MTREEAIEIIKRVDICANAAETARDMAISALREPIVVRCKDCKHWHEETGFCEKNSQFVFKEMEWNMFTEDDFCSYGERKDNE